MRKLIGFIISLLLIVSAPLYAQKRKPAMKPSGPTGGNIKYHPYPPRTMPKKQKPNTQKQCKPKKANPNKYRTPKRKGNSVYYKPQPYFYQHRQYHRRVMHCNKANS